MWRFWWDDCKRGKRRNNQLTLALYASAEDGDMDSDEACHLIEEGDDAWSD